MAGSNFNPNPGSICDGLFHAPLKFCPNECMVLFLGGGFLTALTLLIFLHVRSWVGVWVPFGFCYQEHSVNTV
ncbi:unnamed protein product [Calypogeia fissa]